MRIALLSDTHIKAGQSLPTFVTDILATVDLTLHAGDIVSESALSEIETYTPLVAVAGNGDLLELPPHRVVTCEGIKIGLIHGHQTRNYNSLVQTFAGSDVRIIVFGHSHVPAKCEYKGHLLFNPGSPTQKRGQQQHSLGVLSIAGSNFSIDHLYFD